ncbi:MAG: two pore domain potassium channel family protein, partial [Muribaculaceae bacterium]|nr:two pore domain potassium channel family protein [Muribaculaceae bacterium]
MITRFGKPTAISKQGEYILATLHILVLIASCVMITWITRSTLRSMSFLVDSAYLNFQFWVCILFMVDIAVEWYYSPQRWHYILANSLFILISIPYLNIIHHFNLQLPGQVLYLIRFIPIIRAGYVLALVSGALTENKSLSIFWVYIIWVIASLYIGALLFFVEEHAINPQVDTIWPSLWWAALDMTTVGSNI